MAKNKKKIILDRKEEPVQYLQTGGFFNKLFSSKLGQNIGSIASGITSGGPNLSAFKADGKPYTEAELTNRAIGAGLNASFNGLLGFSNINNSNLNSTQKTMATADQVVDTASNLASVAGPVGQAVGIGLNLVNTIGGSLIKTPKVLKDFSVADQVATSTGFGGVATAASDAAASADSYSKSGLFGKLFGKKKAVSQAINSNSKQYLVNDVLNKNKAAKDAAVASTAMFDSKNTMKNYNSNYFINGSIQYGKEGMTLHSKKRNMLSVYQKNLMDLEYKENLAKGLTKFNSSVTGLDYAIPENLNKTNVNAYDKSKYVYRGPTEFKECVGDGCSKIATKNVANAYGVSYAELSPQDAWYKKAEVLKNGGEEVFNVDNPKLNNYDNVRVGDFVSLDRPGDHHGKDLPKTKSLTLEDNENVEHIGYIIGFDDKGKPLVRHGSQDGKSFVDPIDQVELKELGLKYKAKSIYRSAAIKDKQLVNDRDYRKLDKPVKLNFNSKEDLTKDKQKFIDAYNKNSDHFQRASGLNAQEVAAIGNIAYGIFGMESTYNESPKRVIKQIGAEILHGLKLKNNSPSLGPTQIKYDDIRRNADKTITPTGKVMDYLGVRKGGLSNYSGVNYNDVTKATFARLAELYKKLKSDKYEYNAENNTIFGKVPIGYALARSWQNPNIVGSKETLLANESDYSKGTYSRMNELEGQMFPNTLKEVVVTAKRRKEGGKLSTLASAAKSINVKRIAKDVKPKIESVVITEDVVEETAEVKVHKEGGVMNVIVEGKLHAHKHDLKNTVEELADANITLKGVPVVQYDAEGGVIQTSEVEEGEVILHFDLTKKLEELRDLGTDEAMIEAGKLLSYELVKNTKDNVNKLLKKEQ